MKTRIAFVNGIWQLCMVVAAFRQEKSRATEGASHDFLVIYSRNTGNLELTQFVEQISAKFWDWQGVTQLSWMPASWDDSLRQDKQRSVQPVLEKFDLTDAAAVDEIWLCKLQFLDERLFADIFSRAELVVYEDGLHTYAETHALVRLPNVQLSHPRTAWVQYTNFARDAVLGNFDWAHEGMKRSHLRRVRKFYSVLGTQIAIPKLLQSVPLELVEPGLLQSFFLELSNRLNCNLGIALRHQKAALLLGSNLSHLANFPRALEVSVFTDLVKQLEQRGYAVLWKEHPRNKRPLFADIQQNMQSEHLYNLESQQKIPIEVLVAHSKLELCCSTLSSSLFYLRYIYGMQTVTCVRPLLKYLRGDFHQLSELTLTTIGEKLQDDARVESKR